MLKKAIVGLAILPCTAIVLMAAGSSPAQASETYLGPIDSNLALASATSTASTTPMKPWRYAKKTAHYEVIAKSEKYKSVWSTADSEWSKKGFNWVEADSSKTTVSTYSDDSKKGLELAGKCDTEYRSADGHIVSNKVRLNRAVFNKYDYSKREIINVAEHELGHALGLAHNKKNSVSVMNPSNRSYGIQACDVRGMEKRYSTEVSGDSSDPDATVTVTTYVRAVKPALTHVKWRYLTKARSLRITGSSVHVDRVAVRYGSKTAKTVKVGDKGKFSALIKFSGSRAFSVYGLNKAGKRVTPVKIIKKAQYATERACIRKAMRSKTGITYRVESLPSARLRVSYKGKLLLLIPSKGKTTRFFISQRLIQGKKGTLSLRQQLPGKKASGVTRLPIIKIGRAVSVEY